MPLTRRGQAQAVDIRPPIALPAGIAPAPCSEWCPRCRRYGSGRRPRPSWPDRSRSPRRCNGRPSRRLEELDVAVEDALAVGIGHGLGHLDADARPASGRDAARSGSDEAESSEEPKQGDRLDGRPRAAPRRRPAAGCPGLPGDRIRHRLSQGDQVSLPCTNWPVISEWATAAAVSPAPASRLPAARGDGSGPIEHSGRRLRRS